MRRRLSYANIAATLALVFSMTGGALAANHYLISSTKQISPTVLKKLKGNTGATGKTGAAGPTGKEGAAGKEGLQGKEGAAGKEGLQGKEGKTGTVPASLVSGTSESGDWAVAGGPTGGFMNEGIAFPEPLAASLDATHVEYKLKGATGANCPGVGKAAPGFLCVYEAEGAENSSPRIDEGLGFGGADAYGFVVFLNANGSSAYAYGHWTVTAP